MPNYVELPFAAGFKTYVSQAYGEGDHGKLGDKLHPLDPYLNYALDFHAPLNTPVYAQGIGKVIDRRDGNSDGVTSNSGLGNYVTIQYYDAAGHQTFVATYAHLEKGTELAGTTVNVGTLIGKSGASGGVYDPHLHVTYGLGTVPYNGMTLADGSKALNGNTPPVWFVESADGNLHDYVPLVGDNGHPPAPKFTGFSPDSGVVGDGITSSKFVYVNGTAEMNSSVLLYDGNSFLGLASTDSNGNFKFLAGSLSDGQHQFVAYDVDKLNYVSSASNALKVTIDTVVPTPSITNATLKNGIDSISGTVNDLTVKSVAISDGSSVIKASVTNGSWGVSLNLNQNTVHQLTVTATDAAGNVGKALGSAIFGSSGADTLVSPGDHTFLFGGPGTAHDTFVFHKGFGKDVVGDFHPGEDILQFDKSLFANSSTVLSHTSDDGHGNAVITYDATDTVTLTNVTKAQLAVHLSDFHLV